MTRPVIALDIGGTVIKAALIHENGQQDGLRRIPTPRQFSPEDGADMMAQIIRDLLMNTGTEPHEIRGVGASIAAFITADGRITATAHLPDDWIGFDLGGALRSRLPHRYVFALDTPAPTLGEAYFGAGRGCDDFVYVTISTGIGAGIYADGRYFTGGLGWAGGIGHIIIDETSSRVCSGCGNAGCLETFAATQGVLDTAHDVAAEFPQSLLAQAVSQPDGVTPKAINDAAMQGDHAALEVWRRVGHALGIGLVNLINIVSPTTVILGGGIAQAGELLLAPARAVVQERAFPPQHRQSRIVQAALGDLSALYGAAVLVFHDLVINTAKDDC
jgi:glucokinase